MGKYQVPNSSLKVTEHAIVRYLQRVQGIDIEAAVAEMVPNDELNTLELLRNLPTSPSAEACWFACGTHVLLIQGGTIVTVLTRDMVDLPDGEWDEWTSKAVMRPLPVEGTPFALAVEREVQRRVSDEGWQRRQETDAMKNVKRQIDAVHQQYKLTVSQMEAKIKELAGQLEEAKGRLKKLHEAAYGAYGFEKTQAMRMCEYVKELLGEEKYAELEAEAIT